MHELPGTIPGESTRRHPRRIPAHKSVSLRHSPPSSELRAKSFLERQPTVLTASNPSSDKANPPSVSPKLASNKNSSGESSDAGRWFETTNNNAQQSSATFADSQWSDRDKVERRLTVTQMNPPSFSATLHPLKLRPMATRRNIPVYIQQSHTDPAWHTLKLTAEVARRISEV
jgi:hypothetical protein